MKKNASFITIDSSSIKWLIEKMSQVPNNNLHSLKELKDELSELLQGEISSLILNTDELDEDYTVSTNVLKFNELEINAKNRTVQESGRAIVLTPKEFEILYFWLKIKEQCLQKNRYIMLYGMKIIFYLIAILWHL